MCADVPAKRLCDRLLGPGVRVRAGADGRARPAHTQEDLHVRRPARIHDDSSLVKELGEMRTRRLNVMGERPFSPDGLSVVYENEAYDQSGEADIAVTASVGNDNDAGEGEGSGSDVPHTQEQRRAELPEAEREAFATPTFCPGADPEADPESQNCSGHSSQSNVSFAPPEYYRVSHV